MGKDTLLNKPAETLPAEKKLKTGQDIYLFASPPTPLLYPLNSHQKPAQFILPRSTRPNVKGTCPVPEHQIDVFV